eukprot:m.159281 g.159281  ORF g.159281 m.159281 type:complete len:185 (-) comp31129_c2_seq10:47-601(-)
MFKVIGRAALQRTIRTSRPQPTSLKRTLHCCVQPVANVVESLRRTAPHGRQSPISTRTFANVTGSEDAALLQFHHICDESLENLSDEFNDIMDTHALGDDFDVMFGDGVLTFKLGDLGTYVINKQTPNQQIWLSSPVSGPKRYTYDPTATQWMYAHDNVPLHERLSTELSDLLKEPLLFKVPEI